MPLDEPSKLALQMRTHLTIMGHQIHVWFSTEDIVFCATNFYTAVEVFRDPAIIRHKRSCKYTRCFTSEKVNALARGWCALYYVCPQLNYLWLSKVRFLLYLLPFFTEELGTPDGLSGRSMLLAKTSKLSILIASWADHFIASRTCNQGQGGSPIRRDLYNTLDSFKE